MSLSWEDEEVEEESLSCLSSSDSPACRLLGPGVTLTWISSVVLESVSVSRLRLVRPAVLVREPLGLE